MLSIISYMSYNCSELIQSLVCDVNQHQGFVFIVGDLNYRIDMDAQTVYLEYSFIIL